MKSRYRIERELGRGGMATVYLARDLKHDRQVALKVLHPECSAAVGATRFLREIQLTARLQHAGILPLFDSGEADGQLWYTMPFLDGGTLRERLRREGPRPLSEAGQLVCQVAAALDYAHQHGVVHRDIKPENILLQGGQAVVADFGIARALDMAGGRLTETGFALGTPEYMSPEQAFAEGRVDGRSDVYSLACVVYELLTGEPPYTGVAAQAVMAKQLSAPVPRLGVLRPDASPALERVVGRALAKNPADRYPTAGAFAHALEAALGNRAGDQADSAGEERVESSGAAARRRRTVASLAALLICVMAAGLLYRSYRSSGAPSAPALDRSVVAVLPFRVTAPDSDSNYLREGAVDLLNAWFTGEAVPRGLDSRTVLSRWRRVSQGRELSDAEGVALGRELGAGYVIVGEVVRRPARLTVSGRVLRASDGHPLVEHSETSTAGALDELGLIERWAGRVIAATVGEATERLPHLSDSADAVKAYLIGRQAHTRGELESAAAYYQRALDIDSTFALAAFWLVAADGMRDVEGGHGEFFPEHARCAWSLRGRLSEGDQAQLSALLGPRYPESYTMAELIRTAERAAELNPGRSEAVAFLGTLLVIQGAAAGVQDWLPRATVALDSAIKLDSAHGHAVWWRWYTALIAGNSQDARRYESLFMRTSPRSEWLDVTRWVTAQALGDSAAFESAISDFRRLSYSDIYAIRAFTSMLGLPLSPLDEAIASRTPVAWGVCARLALLQPIAAMRGQVKRALAIADTAARLPDCGFRRRTIVLALADPGYGSAVERAAREVAAHADTTSDDADAVCHAEMWRVSRGDTLLTRRAVQRMAHMANTAREDDRLVPSGVGRLSTCARLLEAAVEVVNGGAGTRPALERLDSLMREGVFYEIPGHVANLVLARWLSASGSMRDALAAAQRVPYHPNPFWSDLRPAYLQEEGRLAALTGDTAGAIRAYQHYLRLRDRPDPGPMADEVSRVRSHLAELVGEQANR